MEVEFAGAKGTHDGVEDTELSGGEGTDHDATGEKPDSAKVDEASLAGNSHETGHHGALSTGSLLVDLGEEGVGGVGDDGGGNTGNDTGGEGDTDVGSRGKLSRGLAHGTVDGIGGFALDGELGHGVGNLLAEDGDKAGVEAANTLSLEHLDGAVGEAVAELGVGNGTDTDGLKGAEEDIGDGLGAGGGSEVDGGLVVPGGLFAHLLDGLNLEVLNTAELEPALDEVTSGGGTEAGGKGHGALLGNDLTESTDETGVVLLHVAFGFAHSLHAMYVCNPSIGHCICPQSSDMKPNRSKQSIPKPSHQKQKQRPPKPQVDVQRIRRMKKRDG